MAYQPKSYRKFLATSVAAAVVATAVAPVAGVSAAEVKFNDISGVQSWAGDAIEYLVGKGAIEGYPDGTFRPYGSLTRGEAAKILATAKGLEIDDNAKASFSDAANHWSSKYIAAIQEQLPGVIDGYTDGTFKPNGPIKRQEMAKMIVEAYGLEKDANANVGSFTDVPAWAKDYVETLASLGVVNGVAPGKFGASQNVTRAQTAVFVHRTEVPEARIGTEKTFTEVTSVEAVTKTVDNSSTGQKLEFTVNGGIKATVEQVEALGYEIEFQANKDVFDTSIGSLSSTGELSATRLSKIYEDAGSTISDREFTYQVIIKKDDEEFESNSQKVRIEDKQIVAMEIGEPKVIRESGGNNKVIELKTKNLVIGEVYKFDEIPATLPGGVKIDDLSELEGDLDVKYSSSNEAVLVVDSDGKIIPISTGSATVTIESGSAKKDITFTVNSAARVATSAKVAESTVKITRDVERSEAYKVAVTVLDQYGDPFAGISPTDFFKNENEVIKTSSDDPVAYAEFVDGDSGQTDKKGEVNLQFYTTGVNTNGYGDYTLTPADSSKKLATIRVQVAAKPDKASSWKLEANPRTTENKALKKGENKTRVLNLHAYTSEGYYMGRVKQGSVTELSDLRIVSSNNSIYTVSTADATSFKADATLTVRGTDLKAAGTTWIEAYNGSQRIARYQITVTDDSKDVALVTFHDLKVTATNNGPFNFEKSVLNKLVLKSGKNYSLVAATGDVIQIKDSDDKVVGSIKVHSSIRDKDNAPQKAQFVGNNIELQRVGGPGFKSGDKGSIIITVHNTTNGTGAAIYAKSIQVDVK